MKEEWTEKEMETLKEGHPVKESKMYIRFQVLNCT